MEEQCSLHPVTVSVEEQVLLHTSTAILIIIVTPEGEALS